MLGADVPMPERVGFLLSQHDDLTGRKGEPLRHRLSLADVPAFGDPVLPHPLRSAPLAGQATGDMDADRRTSYTRRMRFPGRPSGEATVFELIVWASLLTLLFPLVALVLLFRYRVLQAIVAGYREGASTAGPAEP